MTFRPLLPLIALAGIAVPAASQASTTLTPDRDNTLYDDLSGALSNGAGDRLFAGRTISDLDRRALLRFDVAGAVPAGSTILSAELRLEVVMSRSGAAPLAVGMHRVLADWGEGSSLSNSRGGGGGAPSANGDATWLHTFFPGTTWANLGGDFDATASATGTAPLFGNFTIASTGAAVSDVQAWLDNPAGNYGWLLLGDQAALGDARALASREASDPTIRPQLVLTYDAPVSAQVTTFGTTCRAGSGPAITLTANGVPSLGNAQFQLLSTLQNVVAPNVSISTARLPAPFPLFGCDLWLQPASLILALPVQITTGQVALPVPNNPALIGGLLYGQTVAINQFTAQPLLSSAIELQIGL